LAQGQTDSQGNVTLPDGLRGEIELRLAKNRVAVEQPVRLLTGTTNGVSFAPVVLGIQFDDVCSRLIPPEAHATPQ
jgi:hypothetical protein